jgi:hypothetical protein
MEPEDLAKIQQAARDLSKRIGPWTDCPHCGAPPADQEVRNYDAIWGDGDVYCTKCDQRVRSWDRD